MIGMGDSPRPRPFRFRWNLGSHPGFRRRILPALGVKAVRDLWNQRSMVLVIALMIISGAGIYITLLSTYDSLKRTKDAYYTDFAFAHLFAGLRQAPEGLKEDLEELPGVMRVETRIMAGGTVEVEGFPFSVRGSFLSLPDGRQPYLNRLFIREGRLPEALRQDEAVVSDAFAVAHGLTVGDTVIALLNGKKTALTLVGIGLSPEFIYQGNPSSIIPDFEQYGIFWMNRSALGSAFDMKDAFNHVVVSLGWSADEATLLRRVDLLLEPYGGLGAQSRERQSSHFFITEELRQLQKLSTIIPTIFLGIAAFLLSVVIGRLVQTQRGQISILKAFGYSNLRLGRHYLSIVGVIVVIGLLGGVGFGVWLGRSMAGLYAEYYKFPYLIYSLRPGVFLQAAAVSFTAAFLGVWRSVSNAVSVPPAEAMRPESPERYTRSRLEGLHLDALLGQPGTIIMRQLSRNRWKAAFSVLGVAFALSLVIIGRMSQDSIDLAVDVEFRGGQKYDMDVRFEKAVSEGAFFEVTRIPGVHYAESFRAIPVRLRKGHRSRLSSIQGLQKDMVLRELVDEDRRPVQLPSEGILLTRTLADVLHAVPGDTIEVDLLEGSRETLLVPLSGYMNQYFGSGGYADAEVLARLLPDGRAISGVSLLVEDGRASDVESWLRRSPLVADIVFSGRVIEQFYEATAQTWLIMAFFVLMFAGATAFSVVYNNARISLSERSRELASLRILGLTKREVSWILLGELWILVLLAIPIGFGIGAGLTAFIIGSLETELYRIPMNISSTTLSIAAATIIGTALISSYAIRRNVFRLDLIGVLKTRE